MSRLVTVCFAAAVALALAGCRDGTSLSAQRGPAVHSEHWPALGLDPHEIVFDNGFRIVLVEDHRVPRVAASLQYRFGALSERNGEHGTAHFLEHAMHQGTTTVGVKDRELDRKLIGEIYDTEQELLADAMLTATTCASATCSTTRATGRCREGRAAATATEPTRGRTRITAFLGGVQLVSSLRASATPIRCRPPPATSCSRSKWTRRGAPGAVLPPRSRPHGQRRPARLGGAALHRARAVFVLQRNDHGRFQEGLTP